MSSPAFTRSQLQQQQLQQQQQQAQQQPSTVPSPDLQQPVPSASLQQPQQPQPPLPPTIPSSQPRNGNSTPVPDHPVKPVTACFNCRALRQRCDRQTPCSRCAARGRPCRYPSGSNRGRKHGNAFNHSASVDKLLSRIGETAERDQVVAALLNFAGAQHPDASDSVSPSVPSELAAGADEAVPDATAGLEPVHSAYLKRPGVDFVRANGNGPEPEFVSSLVSPLHIMAAAVTADSTPYQQSPNSSLRNTAARQELIDERLARYFATQVTHQTDWQVLASQPIDSPLKLETSTCDPVAARLIDQSDVAWYFRLFFKYRGPLIGLLDPMLHTPEYVHSTSFVLFSALCALGCAVSDRPRDRVVYPALQSIAEGNMKWAIAVCVKSIETIQTIIMMQYWAPACQRLSDDPYWLRLSHAVQLGRELGIHKPAAIAEHVSVVSPGATGDYRERLLRNYERTWLYTFIADKSFGLITGRSMGVAWKEMPASAAEWYRKPMTMPDDRIVSGIVEMRGMFLNALEQRKRVENTLSAVSAWHKQIFRSYEQTRNYRCQPDSRSTSQSLSVLAFYVDHSIMVFNAQALRDVIAIDQTGASPELLDVSLKCVEVACRLLDTMLYDDNLLEIMVGFHNNLLIMVCHAATEILYAIQRGGLPMQTVEQAAAKVRKIPNHLDKIAAMLPATSAAHLYASLSRFFVCQLDRVVSRTDADPEERGDNEQDTLLADWWKTVDGTLLDSTTWMDMGFLGAEQPVLASNDFQETNFNEQVFP